MTRSENKPSIAAVKELMGANHDMLRKIMQDLLQKMLEGEMTEALGAPRRASAVMAALAIARVITIGR